MNTFGVRYGNAVNALKNRKGTPCAIKYNDGTVEFFRARKGLKQRLGLDANFNDQRRLAFCELKNLGMLDTVPGVHSVMTKKSGRVMRKGIRIAQESSRHELVTEQNTSYIFGKKIRGGNLPIFLAKPKVCGKASKRSNQAATAIIKALPKSHSGFAEVDSHKRVHDKGRELNDGEPHQNVLEFKGVGVIDGNIMLAMEHAKFGNVDDMVKGIEAAVTAGNIKEELGEQLKILILKDTLRGMSVAHAAGEVHGDIHGGNFLISSVSGRKGAFVKICDMGASVRNNDRVNRIGVSDMSRMAPELIKIHLASTKLSQTQDNNLTKIGSELDDKIITRAEYEEVVERIYAEMEMYEVTTAADMFGFGVMAVEILYSQPLFNSPMDAADFVNDGESQPAIPNKKFVSEGYEGALSKLVKDCLMSDPQKRPSASKLLERLERATPMSRGQETMLRSTLESLAMFPT